MNNQFNDDTDKWLMTPIDTWILSGLAFLQQKYQVSPSEFLQVRVENSTVIIHADCTRMGSWLAQELWRRSAFLSERGLGLRVFIKGYVLGEFPPERNREID